MSILFPAPVFGPVHSRRLGVSLGVNLLPPDGKVCSFDCVYCECGLNGDNRSRLRMPSREEVRQTLEARLRQMQAEGPAPDVITFAGNGEPTAHPQFADVIEDTLVLRDRYFPQAKVSVLSNASFLDRSEVFEALKRIDNNILKLDTVDMDYIRCVDRPAAGYDVRKVIDRIKAFEGKCMIQTMFLKGKFRGEDVNNTTDRYVLPWLEAVKEIAPQQVMIYTIDRDTPVSGLKKATPEELNRIRDLVEATGISISVSY
ncbi:MAG: radical SAM protein [Bacteroides sp.]|nr:radical SAM protein [Bacteroides sp.]